MVRTNNVQLTTDLKNPTQEGDYHRLLCMTGPRKGTVIYLKGKRVVVGRGENTDIQIVDAKLSREHAEFIFNNNGYVVTDLNTQNGIIVNDQKIKQIRLEDGAKIVVGQTVIKYNHIVVSHAIVASNGNLPTSEKDERAKSKIKLGMKKDLNKDLDDDLDDTPKKSSKNGFVLIFVIGGALYFLMSGDQDSKLRSSGPKNEGQILSNEIDDNFTQNLSKRSTSEDRETRSKVESLIHSGRREYREGNYFRAMEEFRLALLLSPGNGQASFYMSKAKQRLDEDVVKYFQKGKQDREAKKYQAAIVSYSSILRLLKNYKDDARFTDAYCLMINLIKSDLNNERYQDADIKIEEMHNELGIKKDEINCNQKE